MLTLLRRVRFLPNLVRFSTDNRARERKSRLESDPFDNPFAELETTRVNTGTSSQVELWPRRKLKELYLHTLEFLKELPDDYGYRILIEELTRFRLKVVEDNEDLATIEKLIGHGIAEELIEQAQDEITLLQHMKFEKPWEPRPLSELDQKILEVGPEHPFGQFNFKPEESAAPK